MATEKLSNPAIRSALSRAKSGQPRRKLFDGRGLFLLVIPPAGKDGPKVGAYWRLKYRLDGDHLGLRGLCSTQLLGHGGFAVPNNRNPAQLLGWCGLRA